MKNKFATYFLYAIGEITLVVAGILIAVSIDDYSQKQKDKVQEKKYIDALVKELQGNIYILERDIAYNQDRMDTLKVLKARMAKPAATIDTVIHLARYQFEYLFSSELTLNNTIFQTLESTGEIRILDEALKDSLYLYQTRLKVFSNIVQGNMDFYMGIDSDYHKIFPTSGEEQFLNTKLMDQLWANVDRTHFALRFNALVTNKMIALRYILEYEEYLLLSTQYYLKFIEDNYT